MQDQILTVEQLGALIHKSPASIRSDASRKPEALPPICRLPGNKRLLWRREDVLAWVARFVQRTPSSGITTSTLLLNVSKKRGRPRKTAAREVTL
jgi:hypothetical protein